MIDVKSIQLNLSDFFVFLIQQYVRKVIAVAKVMLQKEEDSEPISLEDIISRSNFKKEFDNYEIKKNFEFLANEILELKSQQTKTGIKLDKISNLKEGILAKVNAQSNVIKINHSHFQIKCFQQISFLKKEVQNINQQHQTSTIEFQEFQKRVESKTGNFRNSLNAHTNYLSKEMNKLEISLMQTTEQILKIKQKHQNYETQLLKTINQLEKKVQKLNQHIFVETIKSKDFQNAVEQNLKGYETVCSCLTIKSNSLNEQMKKLSKLMNEKINDLNSLKLKNCHNSKSIQILQQTMNYLDVYITEQKYKHRLQLSKQQKYFHNFNFDGNTLIRICKLYQYKQFVFFEKVPYDYDFKFKIALLQRVKIMIGVVDYEKQKDQTSSYNSNNAVFYDAQNGHKYPGEIKEGNGVCVGETVQVIIDRKNSLIKWMVNGIQRASHTEILLGDNKRQLYPYVELHPKCNIRWNCDMMI